MIHNYIVLKNRNIVLVNLDQSSESERAKWNSKERIKHEIYF